MLTKSYICSILRETGEWTMKKCVIYARQSSGDSDESESVENQKQKCLELARKEHLEVVGIFDDLNTSGKTYPTGSEDIANLYTFSLWSVL